MRYQGTDIDGPQTDPDRLMIRGIDLVELMREKTFLESVFFLQFETFPTPGQLAEIERFFGDAMRSIGPDDPLFTIVSTVAVSEEDSLNALIAGLAFDRKKEISSIAPPDLGETRLSDNLLTGLYYMAILPAIAGFATIYPVYKDVSVLKHRLEAAQSPNLEFTERIALLFRGNTFVNPGEKRLVEAVLVAFCAGFGFMTPSVMTPRISIGSGVEVNLALIAGCTTAGPWHLGTSKNVIEMFAEMLSTQNDQATDVFVKAFLEQKMENGKKLLGFGHPFFKKDPRVTQLSALVEETGLSHDAIHFFRLVSANMEETKNLFPNLEAIHGAIMTSIGFSIPFFGPSIALIGRSAGMLAHMEERLSKPAFGVKNNVARNFFDKVPMGWL